VTLAMALLGISSIDLLRTFISAEQLAAPVVIWRVVIHATFLLSLLALAFADRIMTTPSPHNNRHA
jgi:uncharacterized protein (TIGR00645 family)